MMSDDSIVELPCYEPAGFSLDLTQRDLLQHVLIIGGTGSGKTTLLHRFMETLIHRPRTGLLIFDAKANDTVSRVLTLAREAGREADVQILGPDGDCYLDLFAPLRSLAEVERMTRRLLLGSGSMGRDNAFWDESRFALVDAALTMLVLTDAPVRLKSAVAFMREWFFGPQGHQPRVDQALQRMNQLRLRSAAERHKVQQVMDVVGMWRGLDERTRSNVRATLMVGLRPLLSVVAGQCFEPRGRTAFVPADVARQGRLCVVSFNATVEPELARLLFRIVKTDFYQAVQQRGEQRGELCGVIADEWPLLATAEDLEALATVRSRGCLICAATQGVAAIDEQLGIRQRKAMLTNFGTLVFMRGREEEVDQLAFTALGKRETIQWRSRRSAWGTPERVRYPTTEWVCAPGALGRLAAHQAYVVRPSGEQIPHAVWFAPWFEGATNTAPKSPAIPRRLALADLMGTAGFQIEVNDATLRELHELAGARMNRKRCLRFAKEYFRTKAILVPEGLERLPTPWLRGLPGILWSLRKPGWTHLPFMLSGVTLEKGGLQLAFAQEQPPSTRLTAYDRIRIAVNAGLYPSPWRKPSRCHAQQLAARAFHKPDDTPDLS